jgi:helicase MOV-10
LDKDWTKKLDDDRDAVADILEHGWNAIRDLGQVLRAGAEQNARNSYVEHYKRLLWTEEHQLKGDLSSFDFVQDRATVLHRARDGLLKLAVPGLAEQRPSLLKGDVLHVSFPGEKIAYAGIVAQIELENALLKFSAKFTSRYVENQRVEVRFTLNCKPMRIFHQGLRLVTEETLRTAILFPQARDGTTRMASRPLDGTVSPFNQKLNEAQQRAVKSVVAGSARQVPYIIFGPPGTGKTTVCVEAVAQLAIRLGLRILVCTPTNTAADFFCEKMQGIASPKLKTRAELLRLVARSRTEVPASIKQLTNWDDRTQAFESPTLIELLKPMVIIATCAKAGELTNLGVKRGHFDLILVDEAGQALEPEVMAPIAALLGADGQLVLAGDPKQLGPVVHHVHARELGLGLSYLDRLMELPIYARKSGQYDATVLTKLTINYRSHPTLLEVPNKLFYDNELTVPFRPADCMANSCLQWELLPTKGVPLIFHGVNGKDMREANSPSWFNPDEATVVLMYVRELLGSRHQPVRQEDIGIITPYNKQVIKIKRALQSDLGPNHQIKVGSTEMFQGQERRVIIISTVRSTEGYISVDAKHHLGFLGNPKRLNVAVTRPIALLIVVGCATVLALDDNWRAFLAFCKDKKACTGEPLPRLDPSGDVTVDEDNLASLLEELLLDDEPPSESLPMPQFD